VTSRRAIAVLIGLSAFFLVAGCASIERANALKSSPSANWHGRLALRIAATTTEQTPDQSFSAAFELQGTPQQGDLLLLTPLGSTAAAIHWMPGQAVLHARGETRQFNDLDQLITQLLGTPVPVTALFAWLAGQAQEVEGWQVDLSAQDQGKILARRLSPEPSAELRVVLDN